MSHSKHGNNKSSSSMMSSTKRKHARLGRLNGALHRESQKYTISRLAHLPGCNRKAVRLPKGENKAMLLA